jgi:hypothetical protein
MASRVSGAKWRVLDDPRKTVHTYVTVYRARWNWNFDIVSPSQI